MNYTDIRQSDAWSEYLKMYGWESIKLSDGSVLRFNNFLCTKRASLQLPYVLDSSNLEEIDKVCRENKVLFLKMTPNNMQDLAKLTASGYKQTKRLDISPNTILLDLTSPLDNLLHQFTSTCRYSIHKADREGCYTEIIKSPDEATVQKFYQIVIARSRKKNFFMYSLKDMLNKVKAFGDESYIVFVYNKQKEILGTKMFLGFQNNIYGIHSGTTTLGQKTTGGYKLLMDCIKYFKESGYINMDLGSVEDPRLKSLTNSWKKYSHYKHEFNGKTVYFNFPYIKWFWR